jgi:hypothetical protein
LQFGTFRSLRRSISVHKRQELIMEERILTRRRFFRTALMVTAGAAGLTFAKAISPAEALPFLPPADPALDPQGPDADGEIELAQSRRERRRRRRRWSYARRRHGRRYRRRRPGYIYPYGGYYYSRPWWNLGPGIYLNLNL